MKCKKIALVALIVASTCALLVPALAMAHDTAVEEYEDNGVYTRYILPSLPVLYYRIDTDVRANSLPMPVTARARGDSFEFRIGYDIDDTYTAGITISSDNGYDLGVIGYRIDVPAYYSSTNNDDYEPRYHDGIIAVGATFEFGGDDTLDTTFNAIDVRYVDSKVLVSVIAQDAGYEEPVSGTLKGAISYTLYNYTQRKNNPDDYEYAAIYVYTGAVSKPPVGDNVAYTYYLSGYNSAITGEYQNGYDVGYSEGLSNGLNASQPEVYKNGYDVGYSEGRGAGYSEGLLDGLNGGDASGVGVAKSIFNVVFEIISTPILGFISVADILMIIIVLAIVLLVLRFIRG